MSWPACSHEIENVSVSEPASDAHLNLRVLLPGEVNGIDAVATAEAATFACVTSASVVAVVAYSPTVGLHEVARCEVSPPTALIDDAAR